MVCVPAKGEDYARLEPYSSHIRRCCGGIDSEVMVRVNEVSLCDADGNVPGNVPVKAASGQDAELAVRREQFRRQPVDTEQGLRKRGEVGTSIRNARAERDILKRGLTELLGGRGGIPFKMDASICCHSKPAIEVVCQTRTATARNGEKEVEIGRSPPGSVPVTAACG